MLPIMPPYTLILNSALPLQVKYHASQMHILYNFTLFSIHSDLYWHHQPWQKLIMCSWKCLQITHIEKPNFSLHLHIYQINTLTGIVTWSNYFPPFHITNGSAFSQPIIFILQLLKKYFWATEDIIATRLPYFDFVWK